MNKKVNTLCATGLAAIISLVSGSVYIVKDAILADFPIFLGFKIKLKDWAEISFESKHDSINPIEQQKKIDDGNCLSLPITPRESKDKDSQL